MLTVVEATEVGIGWRPQLRSIPCVIPLLRLLRPGKLTNKVCDPFAIFNEEVICTLTFFWKRFEVVEMVLGFVDIYSSSTESPRNYALLHSVGYPFWSLASEHVHAGVCYNLRAILLSGVVEDVLVVDIGEKVNHARGVYSEKLFKLCYHNRHGAV